MLLQISTMSIQPIDLFEQNDDLQFFSAVLNDQILIDFIANSIALSWIIFHVLLKGLDVLMRLLNFMRK
jgi:hypothetical protein